MTAEVKVKLLETCSPVVRGTWLWCTRSKVLNANRPTVTEKFSFNPEVNGHLFGSWTVKAVKR